MIKREFRVGDKVTCNFNGKGIVKDVDKEPGTKYKIDVLFDSGVELDYNTEGKAYSNYKRTLYIIPKRKPTLAEVKAKYKELLDSVEEVEFTQEKENFFTECTFCNNSEEYEFSASYMVYYEYLGTKYISEKDADSIVEEMKKFIETEI